MIQFEERMVLPGIVLPCIKNALRTGDGNPGAVSQMLAYDLGNRW